MREKRRKSLAKPGKAANSSSSKNTGAFSGAQEQILLDLQLRVAQMLVESGIDVPTMQRQLERACVIAAAGKSLFSNKKPNHSGIAAMTGLPRNEIKRILENISPQNGMTPDLESRGVDRVVAGWISDSEFLTSDSEPLPLPRSGKKGSFDALVKRYGNDVPGAAMLREMLRRKHVESKGNLITLVSLKGRSPRGAVAKRLASAVSPLVELVATAPDSASLSIGTDAVTIEVPDDISYKLLRRHLDIAVPLFFEQARIAANGIFEKKRKKTSNKNGKFVRLDLISVEKK